MIVMSILVMYIFVGTLMFLRSVNTAFCIIQILCTTFLYHVAIVCTSSGLINCISGFSGIVQEGAYSEYVG